MECEDAAGAEQYPWSVRRPRPNRRRLPPELTNLINGKQEQGLNHFFRRRILRAIHGAREPLSSRQLSDEEGALSEVALSTVAYHMKVLVKYGLVSEDHAEPRRGALEHFFASEVSDDPAVLSVLAQTKELDSEKREDGGES